VERPRRYRGDPPETVALWDAAGIHHLPLADRLFGDVQVTGENGLTYRFSIIISDRRVALFMKILGWFFQYYILSLTSPQRKK
jgi:hypothetical protein